MPLCVLEITYSVTVLKQDCSWSMWVALGSTPGFLLTRQALLLLSQPWIRPVCITLARPKKRTSDWNIQTLHTVVFDNLSNESIARDSY